MIALQISSFGNHNKKIEGVARLTGRELHGVLVFEPSGFRVLGFVGALGVSFQ
jgi:hypothetical protein